MPHLTHLVRWEVLTANALAHRKPSELCSGLREWARSQFRRIPPTLKQFSHEVQLLSEGSNLVSALSRYENKTERREVEQLSRAAGPGSVRERLQAAEPHYRAVHRSNMRTPAEARLNLRIGAGPGRRWR